MPLRDLNFYDIQSTRSYPLDDSATEINDNGERLPSNLLVDAQIKFPDILGQFLWVSGVTVNENLVTVTFLATANAAAPPGHVSSMSNGPFTPVAAISLPLVGLVQNRHYPVNPLYPGVGGWVVFGEGINTSYQGIFSTPEQGILAPQTARPYRGLPVPSIGKINRLTALTGIVNVVGGRDIEVVKETLVIDGCEQDVMVIRLIDEFNRNIYKELLGPCDGRPETDTCSKPGIQFINTVGPDCDCNINIEYRADDNCLVVTQNESCGGEVLDYCLGLDQVCTIKDDFNPEPPADQCEPSESSSSLPSEPSVAPPGPTPSSLSSLSSVPMVCAEFPYIDDFDDAIAQDFEVKIGDFIVEVEDSPEESLGLSSSSINSSISSVSSHSVDSITSFSSETSVSSSLSSSSNSLVPFTDTITNIIPLDATETTPTVEEVPFTEEIIVPIDRTYSSIILDRRNVAIWTNCAMDESPTGSLEKKIQTDLRMTGAGAKINGGLVINYHTVISGGAHDEYFFAELDASTSTMRLRRFTGLNFTGPLAEATPIPFVIGDWYRLKVETTAGAGSSVDITVTLAGITDPSISATFTVNTNRYLPADGYHGVGSDQAHCQFSYFEVDDL